MSEADPAIPRQETAESAAQAGAPPVVVSPPAGAVSSLHYPPDHENQIDEEFQDVKRAVVFYAAMLVPILSATGWSNHTQSRSVEISFWAAGGLYAVIAVFATVWRRDWLDLVRLPVSSSRRWLVVAILAPMVTIAAAWSLSWWAGSVGFPVRDTLEGFGAGGYPVWLLGLWVVGLAPVFEEVAFRGVLLAKLRRVMSPAQAVWVAATLFGVIHFSVLSIAVFLVPLAAVAGYLTRETKSLLPAIAVHAAHNAGIVILSLLWEG